MSTNLYVSTMTAKCGQSGVMNTTAFLDWFTYSDNTIDGQSRKKAYTFWNLKKNNHRIV